MAVVALSILIVALHVGGVLAAVHAVMHTRTPQGAVAWVFGLVLLPYVTLAPYLFLGSSRFHGYTEARRACRPAAAAGTHATPAAADAATARYAAIETMCESRFHHGQRLRLLVDGDATFAALFEAIAGATHDLLVQFFIIHDDAIGRAFRDALLERAAAGVRVRLLFDGIGSHDLPRHYVETLRAGGVAVHPFSIRSWRNRFQLNFRNHRKLVVVDGWRGFVGGLNVGDEYLGRKPPLAPWRDTFIELQGSAVLDLQHAFIENWYWVTRERLAAMPTRAATGSASTLIVATGPADAQETCALFFTAAIHAARERLWLSTPYFVPDRAVSAALRLAVLRGVDVRVLIPSMADHRTVYAASTLYAHDAVRAGLRVFRYGPGFLHQKAMLVDDDTTSIGSMNLDNRSLRLNFELTALSVDKAFASEVEAMLCRDFEHAREIERGDYERTPYLQRVAMHVARLFDPVL